MKPTLSLLFMVYAFLINCQKIEIGKEWKLELNLENKILVENHLIPHPYFPKYLMLNGMYVDPNDTGTYGNFCAISKDNGKTWSVVNLFDVPEGADPWGIITKRGTLLATVLGLKDLFIFRSEDEGSNWQNPISLGRYHDHQTMVEDTFNSRIYLVSINHNDIYVNFSENDGRSFDHTDKFSFSNLGTNTMTPEMLSDGTLLIPYSTFNRPAIRGTRNGGRSEKLTNALNWIVPFTVEEGFGTPMFIGEDCEAGFPVLAIDKNSEQFKDNLYYVCSNQSNNEIISYYSNTKGKSWSSSTPVARFGYGERSERNPFTGMPQIAVNNEGVIGVIWQGRLDITQNDCQHLYFAASMDGGKSYSKPQKVSSKISCMEIKENGWAGKRYKSGGDYTGFIADQNGIFLVVWPDSRNGISQLFMTEIKVLSTE